VIAEHDVPNDTRPGRLVRGRQPAPAGSRGRLSARAVAGPDRHR
jgi:hypothetical protein